MSKIASYDLPSDLGRLIKDRKPIDVSVHDPYHYTATRHPIDTHATTKYEVDKIVSAIELHREPVHDSRHGSMVIYDANGSSQSYTHPIEDFDAPLVTAHDGDASLVDFFRQYEDMEGAFVFDNGVLSRACMAADVDMRTGMKRNAKTLFTGYELSDYGIKGNEVGPKLFYSLALTIGTGIKTIVHSGRTGRVLVAENGRPVYIIDNHGERTYPIIADSEPARFPCTRVDTDPETTELALRLAERMSKMTPIRQGDYATMSEFMPHGMLLIAGPQDLRDYCIPINGENIFRDNSFDTQSSDDELEKMIAYASKIDGAIYLNTQTGRIEAGNLALNTCLGQAKESGKTLNEYYDLPTGAGMKTVRAATLAQTSPGVSIIVRTPKPKRPVDIYVIGDDHNHTGEGHPTKILWRYPE